MEPKDAATTDSAKHKQQRIFIEGQSSVKASSASINNDLDTLYAQLKLSISAPRIARRAGRSYSVWNADKSLVEIKRKEGKFEHFGFYNENKLYLEYYEALYMLEIGRLQLDKDGVTLSIEQAYLLLLGELPSPKFDEYLAYAHLTRAGYILVRHRNKFFSKSLMQAPTEMDCIWAWLSNAVEKSAVPSYIKKTELYTKVKQQIEEAKLRIIVPERLDSNCNETHPPQVDLSQECSEAKRPKLNDEAQEAEQTEKDKLWARVEAKSQIGFLMTEPEFKQFELIFKSLDVIDLAAANSDDDDEDAKVLAPEERFTINFDLYLPNNGFKKNSLMPPIMRVLILDSKRSFPNHAEISRSCRHLWFSTPLLVVCVGDAKQIQAFLYLST